jgi:hypothetical protein
VIGNTQAYKGEELITAVKGFVIQAQPDDQYHKDFKSITYNCNNISFEIIQLGFDIVVYYATIVIYECKVFTKLAAGVFVAKNESFWFTSFQLPLFLLQ